MSTLTQDGKLATISFRVAEDFKRTLDIELATRGVTSQEFCTRAIAEKLGVPVPGEESSERKTSPQSEPRRRKTA